MRFSTLICLLAISFLIVSLTSCLTLKQKKTRIGEAVTEFMRDFTKRDSGNVTHVNYPPLFQDSLLKKMSNKKFKRELTNMKAAMKEFTDNSKDSIFIYSGSE